jgi:hypothetical protein
MSRILYTHAVGRRGTGDALDDAEIFFDALDLEEAVCTFHVGRSPVDQPTVKDW